jgi:hypothetical protein
MGISDSGPNFPNVVIFPPAEVIVAIQMPAHNSDSEGKFKLRERPGSRQGDYRDRFALSHSLGTTIQ